MNFHLGTNVVKMLRIKKLMYSLVSKTSLRVSQHINSAHSAISFDHVVHIHM
jgi:hypothetical protein